MTKPRRQPSPRGAQHNQQVERAPSALAEPPPGLPPGATITGPGDPFTMVRHTIGPLLTELEQLRGHPIVAMYISDGAQLADEQMLHLYEHLRRIGRQKTIGLFLASRGGATEVPWKIVSLFREYTKTFPILIPYRAHSAATLTALGADEIVMTPMSELGPVDPSRRHPLLPKDENPEGKKEPLFISVQDLRHVLHFLKREMGADLPPEAAATVYTTLFQYVHPLAIGALEQSWALSIQVAERVLSTHMDPEADKEKIKNITDALSDHYKSHLYQINRSEARALGLNAVDATEDEAEAMWALHQAYAGLQIAGDGFVNGAKTSIGQIGHMNSAYGDTLGLGHSKASAPNELFAATWESRWAEPPQAASPVAP